MPTTIYIMVSMKTYLTTMFSTEGAKPSEVVKRLHMIGFKPISGNYDFVYEWDMDAHVEEMFNFADKVQETLKGMKVTFKLETVNYGQHQPDEEQDIL